MSNIGQCWVAAYNGQIPPSAYAGGEDNGEPVYVIRSNFQNSLIPGKLVRGHGQGYVPWGGAENPVQQYEVLCDFHGQWLAVTGGNIPPNAVPAGQSDDGEPLFVGRVVHDGALTVGKVQRSHGVLYIPYGGEEKSFSEYEVLCGQSQPQQAYGFQAQSQNYGFQSQPQAHGGQQWIPAYNGQVPAGAVAGGEDNGEPVYVIRANFSGALLPGKLVRGHGQAYVPWGGEENPIQQYEVLCNCPGRWLATSGRNIPPNAVPGGRSEDGETLYIGRVVHDGALTVGKVHPGHGTLYIPYGGEEKGFADYEIFCS